MRRGRCQWGDNKKQIHKRGGWRHKVAAVRKVNITLESQQVKIRLGLMSGFSLPYTL